MCRLTAFLLALLHLGIVARAEPLDALVNSEKLWTLPGAEFMQFASNLGFHWTSNAEDSARTSRPGLTLFEVPLVECIARFEAGKLSELTCVFYARGDAGELTKEQFSKLLYASRDAISKATSVKLTARGKDATSAVKADGFLWQTEKARFLLEYSFTKEVKTRDVPFRAEFIRLEIRPPTKALGLLATAVNLSRSKFTGTSHVKHDAASGDVTIAGVPMVDQGQKGYCVVATTERVMRYYGNDVDANELAQIANASAERGTSNDAMFDALKKLSARLRVRVRAVEEADVRDIEKLIAEYNRAAKKAGAPQIPEQGSMIDVGEVYRAMKAEILREVRTKNKSDLSRFQRNVQARVDQGVPMLWCVMLGLVPEKDIPQGSGGHMRLIIGYNQKAQEILYTDSWGAGHELKRMAAADAWTITTGLTTIEPL